jgi:uncharacterized protein
VGYTKLPVSNTRTSLRLNVGFIRHQSVGYSRDFPIDLPYVFLKPDLKLYNLVGNALVTRTAHGLLLQAKLHAQISAECVRCLNSLSQPLEAELTELYAFTPNSATESGLLLPETGIIDIGPIVREEMLLAIPINPICDSACKGLCPICGENLNETACNHKVETLDPRLSVLKTLLDTD